MNLGEALIAVARLDRTINYPKDPDSLDNLARGLMRAANTVHVDAARIVERCAEISQYCPTDADMMAIARDLRGPQPFVAPPSPDVCPKCHGTGWEIVYSLHTQEGGKHNFTRKERITETQANDLWNKIDKRTQAVYSAAKRCQCPIPTPYTEVPDHAKAAAGDRA